MIDINGWVVLSNTIDGETHYGSLNEQLSHLNDYLMSLGNFNQVFAFNEVNHNHVLNITIAHNHDLGYTDMIEELLNKVAERLVGSYGLVYIWNDEDLENYNNFVVYKLARGQVRKESDPFLSPCNPTIED
jgi:hypothetical protein